MCFVKSSMGAAVSRKIEAATDTCGSVMAAAGLHIILFCSKSTSTSQKAEGTFSYFSRRCDTDENSVRADPASQNVIDR